MTDSSANSKAALLFIKKSTTTGSGWEILLTERMDSIDLDQKLDFLMMEQGWLLALQEVIEQASLVTTMLAKHQSTSSLGATGHN